MAKYLLLVCFTLLVIQINGETHQGNAYFIENGWQEQTVTVVNNSAFPIQVQMIGKSGGAEDEVVAFGPIAPNQKGAFKGRVGRPGSLILEATWEEEGETETSRPLTIHFKPEDPVMAMVATFEIMAGWGTWSKVDWER
jgi:hypothetical protein